MKNEIVGEDFEDYGNAPEYVINRFCAYELIEGNLVRLFLCKQTRGKMVLEYTAVVPHIALADMGRLCLKIAAEGHNAAMWRDVSDTRQ